jgi:hypothetical protein
VSSARRAANCEPILLIPLLILDDARPSKPVRYFEGNEAISACESRIAPIVHDQWGYGGSWFS